MYVCVGGAAAKHKAAGWMKGAAKTGRRKEDLLLWKCEKPSNSKTTKGIRSSDMPSMLHSHRNGYAAHYSYTQQGVMWFANLEEEEKKMRTTATTMNMMN